MIRFVILLMFWFAFLFHRFEFTINFTNTPQIITNVVQNGEDVRNSAESWAKSVNEIYFTRVNMWIFSFTYVTSSLSNEIHLKWTKFNKVHLTDKNYYEEYTTKFNQHKFHIVVLYKWIWNLNWYSRANECEQIAYLWSCYECMNVCGSVRIARSYILL